MTALLSKQLLKRTSGCSRSSLTEVTVVFVIFTAPVWYQPSFLRLIKLSSALMIHAPPLPAFSNVVRLIDVGVVAALSTAPLAAV
ncbi:hypothetical protein ABZS29_25120 [Kribbella sp. NPDC005582]|uniref:hypothetical protein n=1 Tax=Kribbella sp. NPDC005582 TaxID=3156893 RepID=UPI00339E5BEF